MFLPLKTLATYEAKRPSVIFVASTTYHFLSIVAGLAINVFIVLPPLNLSMCCAHIAQVLSYLQADVRAALRRSNTLTGILFEIPC